jgi:hypothetical protein
MAKKKRRVSEKKEDEYEFVPPEFDEREFILKDLYGTKVLGVVALLAVIIGLLAACIHFVLLDITEFGYLLGFLLIILVIAGMRNFLAILKFDTELLEQRTMIGNYILFFFLALGVWIILMNEPFNL